MNLLKLRAPDFFLGKVLLWIRAMGVLTIWLARNPSRESWRLARLIMRVVPAYTMVSPMRLMNLARIVRDICASGLPGDLVECGVWNGGASAVMAATCQDASGGRLDRTVWLFDSFEGLPRPSERDGEEERRWFFEGWDKGDPEKVRAIFRRCGIPLEQVRIIPGWFQDTLASAAIERIAVLHIDADWYDSVRLVLDTLYDNVVPGGFVVVDDYGKWQGSREALHDFLKAEGLDVRLGRVGKSAAYFQKPQARDRAAVSVPA